MSVLKNFFSKPQPKQTHEFLKNLKLQKDNQILKSIDKFPPNKRPDVLANLSIISTQNMKNLGKTTPLSTRLTAASFTPYFVTMAKTDTTAHNQKNSVVLAHPKQLKDFRNKQQTYEKDFDLEIQPDHVRRIPQQLRPLNSTPHRFNSKYRVKSKSRRNIKRRMSRNMITKRSGRMSKKSSRGRIAKRSRRYNKI